MTDTAKLGFSIETGNLPKAITDLDQLTVTAQKTEAAVEKMAASASKSTNITGGGVSNVAKQYKAAAEQIETYAQRIDKALNFPMRQSVGTPFENNFGRASDIAAYGSELDRLRAKFNPLFAAGQQYKVVVSEIREAHRVGAISSVEMTNAIERERLATQRLVETQRSSLSTRNAVNNQVQAGTAGINQQQPRGQGANRALQANLLYQFQDVAVTSAMGMNPAMIALQQGTQIGAALSAAGGGLESVKAFGPALMSLLSPINLITLGVVGFGAAAVQWFMSATEESNTMEKALKDQRLAVDMLSKQYGALGEQIKTVGSLAGSAFTDATARGALTSLQARLRTEAEPVMNQLSGDRSGWLATLTGGSGSGLPGLQNLSGPQTQFAAPVKALLDAVKEGRGDLTTFNVQVDELFNRLLPSAADPNNLANTADAIKLMGAAAFEVTSEFAPFADAINRFKLTFEDPEAISKFTSEVEKIGQQQGLQKLADKAILLAKEMANAAEQANELRKIIQQIDREETRPGLSDRRDAQRYVASRGVELAQTEAVTAAQRLQAMARTNAELLAAAEAQVRATARSDGDKDGGLEARVNRAVADERLRQEMEIRDEIQARNEAQQRSIESARLDLQLVGATTGETTKLRYEYEEIANLREAAAQRGEKASEAEIAKIKETAAELGKLADELQKVQLQRDLQFEREQDRRSREEQEIAGRLRGTGIGMDSAEANYMRDTEYLKQVRQGVHDFANDFQSELLDNGGNIGKAFAVAIQNAFIKEVDELISKGIDALINHFSDAIIGTRSGAGAGGSGLGGVLGAVFGLGTPQGSGATLNGATALSSGASSVLSAPVGAVTRGGALPAVGGSVAEQSWNFFKSKGLPDHQVAGILGNISAESSFNPTAVGDAGEAFGLFQHNDRKNNLFGAIGGKGNLSDVQGQLDFAWKELNTSESTAFNRLKGASNVREATGAFAGFERPKGFSWDNPEGAHNFTGRLEGAESALAKFGGTADEATKGISDLGKGAQQIGQSLSSFFPSAPGGGVSQWGGLVGGLFGSGGISSPLANNAIATGIGGLFAEGGFTGSGGKHDPAGIVHRGEYVFDAASTARIGVKNLEAMRRGGLSGMAYGGYMGGGSPVAARVSEDSSNRSNRTIVELRMSPDLESRVLTKAGNQSVDLIKQNNDAQTNYRQNGGDHG